MKAFDSAVNHRVESGSALIVCEVGRLSRSVLQFCEIMKLVKEKHLRLEALGSITVDCRSGEIDPMSAAFLQMASIFSELEKNILRVRVRSGMENARAKGKQIGRRPTTKADLPAVFIKYYPSYANGSMTVTELARICKLSRPTAYKYIKIMA
ncbi:MAG: recombinase family protein [Bacteroidales bacterium]|nr:recombinase family protein [Bacteroidales bacterium]